MAAEGTFTLNLDGNLEDGADSSEESLEKLRRSILDTTQDLSRMQAALSTMKKGGVDPGNAAFKKLSDQIDVHKKSLGQAQARYVDLGGEFGKLDPPTQELSFLDELMTQIDTSALAVVGAVAAVVAVLGALAVGLVAVTAKVIGFAIASADAARSQNIMLDALLGSTAAATSLQGVISQVAANTSLGREAITGYAKQLRDAGIQGAQLETALQAVSNAASVGADTGKIVSQLQAAKNSAQQFNKVIDRTNGLYGDLAKKSAIGFGAQMARLKESIGELFSGLNLEPFLEGLRSITALFDSNTSSGKALKTLVTTIFQPLLDGAAKAAPSVKDIFRQGIIYALKFTIVALKVRNSLRDALQGPNAGPIKAALYGILVPLALIAIAATAAATATVITFALIGAAVALALAPFAALGVAIYFIIGAAKVLGAAISSGVTKAIDAAKAKISEWVSIGSNFVSSLASGITSGISSVISAAKKVATGAVDAVKNTLKIASPSKVLMQVGQFTSEGMAVGMDDGADQVVSSAESLATAAIPSPELGDGTGGGGARGGATTITIQAVNINGVEGADDPAFLDKMAKAFELVLSTGGLSPEPEPV
ncbi:MAG: hypothetical protein H6718_04100 [Polyangiaceae bacterium]|nr:hypothetical protein [Polyangiaceae bacterium]